MNICEHGVESGPRVGCWVCVCLSGSYRYGGEIPAFLTLAAGPHPYWDRTAAGLFVPGPRGGGGGCCSISQDLGCDC